MDASPKTYRAVDSDGNVTEVTLLKTSGSGGGYARAPVAPIGTQSARPSAKQSGAR